MTFKNTGKTSLMAGAGLALAMAAAAPASAVTFDYSFIGFSGTFDTVDVSRDFVSGQETLADGGSVSLSAPASFSGYDFDRRSQTFSVNSVSNLTADSKAPGGGTHLFETITQSITVSSDAPCVDGCGGPDDQRFKTSVSFSNPAPVGIVFAGLGTFTVDVGGLFLFDQDPTTADISDSGAVPFTVSFAAEEQTDPDPDPGTPAMPLPAGMPLLLGGLGAATLAARHAPARQP